MSDWQVVTEEDVRKAINFLRYEADNMADAIRDRALKDERRKIVLAEMTRQSNAKSHAQAETEARTTAEFLKAVTDLADAERAVEFYKAKMRAAQITVDAWRTQSSNERAVN